jgi:dolichol-phosphate mannosyltransferase
MKTYSDTTVIIPTMNEEGNIEMLLNELQRRYYGIRIIVVDEGSIDSTVKKVIRLAKKNNNISLIDRSKEKVHGLAISVIDGSLHVRTKKTIVMDGDMQHPPNKVGLMVKALDKNDVVIGVRTKVKNWGITRRMLSKGITVISLTVFKIKGKRTTKDMMSGFFGIRTKLLREIVTHKRNEFVDEGYKVLLDILRVLDKEEKIEEIPYSTFHERRYGKSKLLPKHLATTLRSTLR